MLVTRRPSTCSDRVIHITTESRFTPYAQIVFGGATRSLSRQLDVLTGAHIPVFPVVKPQDLFPGANTEITAQVSASQTAFAMAVGGGLDWKIAKRLTFRPIAVDYVLTRFPSYFTGDSSNQNSIRASIGSYSHLAKSKRSTSNRAATVRERNRNTRDNVSCR